MATIALFAIIQDVLFLGQSRNDPLTLTEVLS
jgi:hypothetical protein